MVGGFEVFGHAVSGLRFLEVQGFFASHLARTSPHCRVRSRAGPIFGLRSSLQLRGFKVVLMTQNLRCRLRGGGGGRAHFVTALFFFSVDPSRLSPYKPSTLNLPKPP